MSLFYPSPAWFYGYDVVLELLFAIISLVVASFAFSIFKKTSQRNVLYFGIGFLSISVSYFIQSIFNLLIITKLNDNLCNTVKIISVTAFKNMGLLAHMLFFTIGLSFLLFVTFKENRLRLLWFLVITALLVIGLSHNYVYMFYLVASIYLLFISWHYFINYLKQKNFIQLLVLLAFIFLLFGQAHYLVSVNHELYHVISHILELFAYLFILANFYMVRKK